MTHRSIYATMVASGLVPNKQQQACWPVDSSMTRFHNTYHCYRLQPLGGTNKLHVRPRGRLPVGSFDIGGVVFSLRTHSMLALFSPRSINRHNRSPWTQDDHQDHVANIGQTPSQSHCASPMAANLFAVKTMHGTVSCLWKRVRIFTSATSPHYISP